MLCSEVIRTHETKASAYKIRGLAYSKQDNYDPAIADFTKAIGINPKDADAYFYRARVFEKAKQYGKALDDLVESYEIKPNVGSGMDNNLAWFLATCPDDEIRDGGKAAEYIDHGLESRPNDPLLWDTCAAVFAEIGDFEDAIDWEKAYLDRTDITEEDRSDGEKRLALYVQNQPYRKQPEDTTQFSASITPAQPGK